MPSHSVSLRRIPPELRKRAALSCDLCKTRRRKCVRSASGESCQLCKENRVRCITTIPRKQRTRAPMEDLSPRHIIIEELVSRLFPKVATRDLNELTKLAEYLNKHKVEISLLEDKICISAPQMEIFSPTIDPYQPLVSDWGYGLPNLILLLLLG